MSDDKKLHMKFENIDNIINNVNEPDDELDDILDDILDDDLGDILDDEHKKESHKQLQNIEIENEDITVKKYRIIDNEYTKYDCYFYNPWCILVIIETNKDGDIKLYDIINIDKPNNKYETENGNIYEIPLNDLLISKSWLANCKSVALHNSEALIQNIINEFKSKPNIFLTLPDIISNTFDKSFNLLLKEKYNESIEGFNHCIIIAKEINQQWSILQYK